MSTNMSRRRSFEDGLETVILSVLWPINLSFIELLVTGFTKDISHDVGRYSITYPKYYPDVRHYLLRRFDQKFVN